MGVLSTNRSQITSGGLISASFISDAYDVLLGTKEENTILSGSITVSGSLNITGNTTGSFTGSLSGTATTASYIALAASATTAATASYVTGSNVIGIVTTAYTSSISTTSVTASYALSGFQIASSGSLGELPTVVNGALAVSSSGDLYFASASAWHKVTLG